MKRTSLLLVLVSAGPLLLGVSPQAWSDPGEIIITRTVSPRSAFRPGSGPVSAQVNPGQQVQSALGLDQNRGGLVGRELSNSAFANVATGIPFGGAGPAVHGADLTGALAGSRLDGVGGGTAGRVMAGPVGAGAGAGASIGGAVQQATGQLMNALKGAGLIGR